MKIDIRANVQNENLIKAYKNLVDGLDKKIVEMIEEKGVTLLLTHSVYDIYDSEHFKRVQKDYVEDMTKYPYRGMMSNDNKDNAFYIAVFEKHLALDELEGVFYHEAGHFLDGYSVIEQIEPDLKEFLSGKSSFQEAYNKDITENWSEIKNDKRFKLIHYVESSTPSNSNPIAVVETFAEAFAVLNSKKYVGVIEPYFKNSIEMAKVILKEAYDLELP